MIMDCLGSRMLMGQNFRATNFEATKLGGEPSKPHIKRLWDIFLTYGCRRILDAGCGFGWFGRYKPEGVEVIGVDINEDKLKIAQTYEKVVKGNVCFLPFRDSSFDGILASHILEHVQNDHRAMKEFYRVLRVGGFLSRRHQPLGAVQQPIQLTFAPTIFTRFWSWQKKPISGFFTTPC